MYKKPIKILAIETSCDETSAAVIGLSQNLKIQETRNKQITNNNIQYPTPSASHPTILSNIVSSQIDLHAKTGGVVPEVASRAHMEAIIPVIEQALLQANPKIQDTRYKQESNNQLSISSQKNLNSKTQVLSPDALSEITHIAVTAGPGLIGSLLVGFNTAKALAYSLNIPIIPINHIEGHIYSALAQNKVESRKKKVESDCHSELVSESQNNLAIQPPEGRSPFREQFNNEPKFPILALTVSGGHTSLTLMKDHGVYENIGQTLDDAAGEAFDKVAKLLDLGYPGGPVVSRLASEYRQSRNQKIEKSSNVIARSEATKQSSNLTISRSAFGGKQFNNEITFPRPILNDGTFNFSFSGLKTAVLTYVKKLEANSYQLTAADKSAICYAFEEAVVDVLVTKTLRACEKYNPKAVILAGGVAANKRLREELTYQLSANSYKLILPPAELCGDNAAMIGVAAYYHILKNDIKSWNEISVDSNLKL